MASIFRNLWPLLVFLSGAIKPLGAEVLGCSLNCSIKTRVGALWSLGLRVLASVNEEPGTKHATNLKNHLSLGLKRIFPINEVSTKCGATDKVTSPSVVGTFHRGLDWIVIRLTPIACGQNSSFFFQWNNKQKAISKVQKLSLSNGVLFAWE